MKFLVAAVTCVIDDKEEVILDPTSKQEKNATALLTFVFDNKDFNVVTVNTKGSYSSKQFKISCIMILIPDLGCSVVRIIVSQVFRIILSNIFSAHPGSPTLDL
jgi:exosome complex RNA-binding protein Rrp42 (RNase PH superfamily)